MTRLLRLLHVLLAGCSVCGRPPRWRAVGRKRWTQHTTFCPRRER